MAVQTSIRRRLKEHEEKTSTRNGLTSHGNVLINGHAGLQRNGHPQFAGKEVKSQVRRSKESFEKVPFITAALTHLGFYILMFLGFINQLLFTPKVAREYHREGYAPLYENFERFYLRYVYRRVRDCWNRPICSVPGATVTLKDRETRDYGWTFQFTGTTTQCINLGSYNYMGFAETNGECADQSIEVLKKFGCASCSTRLEFGGFHTNEAMIYISHGKITELTTMGFELGPTA